MTKIIDRKEIDLYDLEFTCTACELDIDVSSFLYDTELSRKNPQNRLAILVRYSNAYLKPEGIPIQMVILTDEPDPDAGNPSKSIDTRCVSCDGMIDEGYTAVSLKCEPEDVTEDTQVEFSNSTICPFCKGCVKVYMEAYDEMKSKSIDLKTHII